MITKTVTDDATGLKKAVVSMDLPAIQVTTMKNRELDLNQDIKLKLLEVVSELIDKNLT